MIFILYGLKNKTNIIYKETKAILSTDIQLLPTYFIQNNNLFCSLLNKKRISRQNLMLKSKISSTLLNFDLVNKIEENYFKLEQKIPYSFLSNYNQICSISGIKIGKGFLGNIKKNKFKRGPMSHGSKNHRLAGSSGSGTTPGRVFKGKKMAGRAITLKVTFKNVIILNCNNNILSVKGSLPGKKNNLYKLIFN